MMKVNDIVRNKHTGEKYTVIDAEPDLVICENNREKRAFGIDLTYSINDLEVIKEVKAMKCELCKNKDICKYVECMNQAEEHVRKFGFIDPQPPIKIEAKCYRYESKEHQNGIGKLATDSIAPREPYKPYTVRYQE